MTANGAGPQAVRITGHALGLLVNGWQTGSISHAERGAVLDRVAVRDI